MNLNQFCAFSIVLAVVAIGVKKVYFPKLVSIVGEPKGDYDYIIGKLTTRALNTLIVFVLCSRSWNCRLCPRWRTQRRSRQSRPADRGRNVGVVVLVRARFGPATDFDRLHLGLRDGAVGAVALGLQRQGGKKSIIYILYIHFLDRNVTFRGESLSEEAET